MRQHGLRGQHRAEACDAPRLLKLARGRLLEWLDRQHMRIVYQHVDATGVWLQSRCDIRRLRNIAAEMGVDAPALFNSSLEMFRPVCPGEAEDVVAAQVRSKQRRIGRAIVFRSTAGCWR